MQLGAPNIGNGTATTTFFVFFDDFNRSDPGALTITHEDGVLAAQFDFSDPDDPIALNRTHVASAGPNGERTTTGVFDDSFLDILYVATNGDPSVLKVDVSAVPLPAGLPLLVLGLGSIAALRRRRG